MKSSPFLNGTLTALFVMTFFCAGISPGHATILTPTFTDCVGGTPSWNIRHGEETFLKETAIMCRYDSDPLPDHLMTWYHFTTAHREMTWTGDVPLMELERPTSSPFGKNPLSGATDKSFEGTLFMTEMFWNHVDTPFGAYEYSSLRFMIEGRP